MENGETNKQILTDGTEMEMIQAILNHVLKGKVQTSKTPTSCSKILLPF